MVEKAYYNKSIDYDYIIEEFHYEYKLDVKEISMCIINLIDLKKQYDESDDTFDIEVRMSDVYKKLNVLWPEVDIDEFIEEHMYDNAGSIITMQQLESIIPATIVKPIYFVQSPKDPKSDLPSIHYSLKEKFLSDFRALRKKAKQAMEDAEAKNDHASYVRYNAKQLAIKVICNSEYGASGNSYFSHYDPDIAAAVTHCARSLIGFLTSNLQSKTLYVDKKFLDDNDEHVQSLLKCNAMSISKLTDDQKVYQPSADEVYNINASDDLYFHRRNVVRRIFNDTYELLPVDVYKLSMQPSKVVYQDTDSNYYENEYIINHFTKDLSTCSPEIIDKMMWTMYHHNMLLSNFASVGIARRPIGLGFEGSFIVCRYLNRKKKYYGKQWSADGTVFPDVKLCDDAYVNGVLKEHYNEYYKPKKSVLPYEDGTYIDLNYDRLLRSNVNYLDYVKSFGVKCTGVDLARRDQFKFINFHHIMILKNDLQIMKYNGNNQWSLIDKDKSMIEIIDDMIDTFIKFFDDCRRIARGESYNEPRLKFNLLDFSKTAAYRPDKTNTVLTIVNKMLKLIEDGHEEYRQYIPKNNERISFVIVSGSSKKMSDNTKLYQEVINDTCEEMRKDLYKLIPRTATESLDDADKEFLLKKYEQRLKEYDSNDKDKLVKAALSMKREDELKNIDVKELFNMTPISKHLTFDTYLNARCIAKLHCEYYLKCLAKAIALYIIGDVYKDTVKILDEGTMLQTEINAKVSELQDNIANQYLVKYKFKAPSKSLKEALYNELSKDDNSLKILQELRSLAPLKINANSDKAFCSSLSHVVLASLKTEANDVISKGMTFVNKYKRIITLLSNGEEPNDNDDRSIEVLYERCIESDNPLEQAKGEYDKLLKDIDRSDRLIKLTTDIIRKYNMLIPDK